MPAGLPVMFLLIAQAASVDSAPAPKQSSYGPVETTSSQPVAPPSDQTQRQCAPQPNSSNGNEIVVCAVKPDGYRLPPDIVEARRLKKQGVTIRPHNPHEKFADHSCANVGPMGCRGTPTLNMLAVAATAAEISKRIAKGQEIGSVFETEKTSSDYELYLMAKKERETKEAAAAAQAAKAKARAAAKANPAPAPASPQSPASSSTPSRQTN